MHNRSKNADFILLIWYFTYFFLDCVMQTYFVKFMGARGLADTEIGIASSIATVVPIVAVPFWARLADRARYKNALLALSTVAPALIALLFQPDLEIPAIFLGTVALFHFFACPHDMYSNAITLEYLSANNRPFGRVRLMGAAGWAVSGLVTGWILDKNIALFVPFYVGGALALQAIQCFVPRIEHKDTQKQKIKLRTLLRRPGVMPLLISSGITALASGLADTFFLPNYEALGGNTSSFGLFLFFITLTELPVLFFSDRVLRRFSPLRTLMFAGTIAALRFLYIFLVPDYRWFYFLVLVQGLLILRTVVMVVYMDQVAPAELKVTAQMLTVIVSGVARALGASLSGYAATYLFHGFYRPLFLAASLLQFASIFYLWMVLRKQKMEVRS